MITLITGLPGNGKTLYALAWLKERAEKEGRQVHFSGIADLKLPWIEHDPTKWFELPHGSIVIIDEVQRIMRPRMHGTTVPDYVAKLETHRHLGIDLVLITQHPMLLDSNVRRLVGQHFHVVRRFGTHSATVHEWNACKESCDKNREDSIKHAFRYPKDVFALYKSAELHTHKARIPMKVWALLAMPVIVGGICWWTWSSLLDPERDKPAQQLAPAGPVTGTGILPASTSTSSAPKPLTPAEYAAQFEPRIAGLHYTAPAYDELTKPTRAPYPAACVTMRGECRCYTQQATRLEVADQLCRSIVGAGFFVAWDSREPPEVRAQAVERLERRPDQDKTPVLISLGGNPRAHILSD